MNNLLSVNTIIFSFRGYDLSYVEFFGTLFYLWSVILAVKNKVLTWPTSVIGVILFAILFYQIQLYSDLLEQIYYLATAFWGWWVWLHPKTKKEEDVNKELKVSYGSALSNLIYLLIILIATFVFGYFIGRIHLFFPKLFPLPASFPYLDAFTTVMSFVATILMVKRKIESWYLWILVDIIGIGLYFAKSVVFLSLLYSILLFLAAKGYFNWRKVFLDYQLSKKSL